LQRKDNNGEKITTIQLRSTEQRSTVDLRRRLTNFKNVSQSFNVSSLETVCLTNVKY